ncbi:uncharacterized protein YcnI [Actinoalloteichus hoggarensis]|uniref:YncI copper-binding domain-containing protein n=1 Tax=Actinoalloteichus hoggarensis TaxID=1470176 RepID=A0A221VW26_9PSEU|nr:YcnI family protein [Actinoalloteichus hoggarensis]ASO17725.1 hypothetical protein AHOG_00250 [Actinoalloteichus hoggarensis]MBB5922851.1 uncharacterized protein YcnI [Actinoalloteichus hoggarensis]
MSTFCTARRLGGALALAGVFGLAGAGTALAHVTAVPDEATSGGFATFALRVPNERPDAGTVSVSVSFPAEYPLSSVRTRPQPGWTVEVERFEESEESDQEPAVSTITWTAEDGAGIAPDEFQEFSLSLGGLPTDTDHFVMPAVQTYDSGEVVAWDEPPTEDGEEPARPAPMLTLVEGDGGHGHGDGHGTTTRGTESGDAESEDAVTASGAQDDTARLLGGGGLVVGALGVGFGIGAMLRARRR